MRDIRGRSRNSSPRISCQSMSTSIDLREEAMAPEIETVAVDLDGLRKPTDLAVGFNHNDGTAQLAQEVASRQARRAAAQDDRHLVFVAVDCHLVPARALVRSSVFTDGCTRRMLTTPHIDDRLERFEEVSLLQDLVASGSPPPDGNAGRGRSLGSRSEISDRRVASNVPARPGSRGRQARRRSRPWPGFTVASNGSRSLAGVTFFSRLRASRQSMTCGSGTAPSVVPKRKPGPR